MNYTISNIYDNYENKEITKSLFKDICAEFNIEIIESILDISFNLEVH